MAGSSRLCVTNQKGGVGKTTVAINVAGALNRLGRDVLFVDLDPQGNATEGLGLLEAYDAEYPTLLDGFLEAGDVPIDDLIYAHAEMDVLASNIEMNAAEASLLQEVGGETRLASMLEEVDDDYDYVVVDCPPHLGMITDNALYAARNLVIPALAESTSKRSLELLFDYVSALERDHGIRIDTRALVVNRIENTNEAEAMLEWFGEALPDVPNYEVRKRVALQRAFAAGTSIFRTDERVDMCDIFLEIAETIDQHDTENEVPA